MTTRFERVTDIHKIAELYSAGLLWGRGIDGKGVLCHHTPEGRTCAVALVAAWGEDGARR